MVRFDGQQQKSVKRLSFNQKINKLKKEKRKNTKPGIPECHVTAKPQCRRDSEWTQKNGHKTGKPGNSLMRDICKELSRTILI